MEKKKLQRVIGISVVVAFVIVLIPFLFGKREMPQSDTTAQTTTEQTTTTDTTQVTAANTDPNQQPTTIQDNTNNPNPTDTTNTNTQNTTATTNADDNGITPITAPPVASNDQNIATPTNTNPNSTDTTPKPTTPDVTGQSTGAVNQPTNPTNTDTNTTPTVAPTANETATPTQNTLQAAPATDTTDNAQAQPVAEKTTAMSPVKEVKSRHIHKNFAAAKKARHITQQASINPNKPAWVVQMGSFKDQSNATRMAAQLKTSGFKVFTREVKSASGNVRTRVYIGPEYKQASAQQLSTKIQHQTKLQGYVIPYKSIAL